MKVERLGEYEPSDFDPKVSGENITPTAKKATAVKNRVIQAISPILLGSLVKKMGSFSFGGFLLWCGEILFTLLPQC